MWIYEQATGRLIHDTRLVATGYSGAPQAKNNPRAQHHARLGPIPCGEYEIGPPYDSDTIGPFVLMLVPGKLNRMFGRSAFRIHGDSRAKPGEASQGCIIVPRDARAEIWASGDRQLVVVPGVVEPWGAS